MATFATTTTNKQPTTSNRHTMQQTIARGSTAATRGAAQPSSARCLGPRPPLSLLRQQQQRGSVRVAYREGDDSSRAASSSSKPKGGSPYTPGYTKQPGGSSSSGVDEGFTYGIPSNWADGLQDSWRDLRRRFDSWPSEKRTAALGVAAGAGLMLYLANGLLNSIDGLPLLPGALQFVGLTFSVWFTWRYLLFAEGRQDLAADFTLDKLTGRAAHATAHAAQRAADSAGAALDEGRERLGGSARPSGGSRAESPGGAGDGGSRLSDGGGAAYSSGRLDGDIKSALGELDRMAE